jgi:CO/xanthine dehydrogenase FAD-binding subunit
MGARGIRIAVGAVGLQVTRARQAEEILEEGGPDAVAKASEAAATEVETVSDVDGSDAYKRHLVEVLLHRSLTSVYERNS